MTTNETVKTIDENHKVLKVTVYGQAYFVRSINGSKVGPAFDTEAEAVRAFSIPSTRNF